MLPNSIMFHCDNHPSLSLVISRIDTLFLACKDLVTNGLCTTSCGYCASGVVESTPMLLLIIKRVPSRYEQQEGEAQIARRYNRR